MAYVKRVSNAKNTTTMSHNQTARFFDFSPGVTGEPAQTVLSKTIQTLQTQKQDKFTESAPLSSSFIQLPTGQFLEDILRDFTVSLGINTEAISIAESGGIESISVNNGVTTIDGTTEINTLFFSGDSDSPDVYQTTAYTNDMDSSLRYYIPLLPRFDISIQTISSAQQTHTNKIADLSGRYDSLYASVTSNTNTLAVMDSSIPNLSLLLSDISSTLFSISGQLHIINDVSNALDIANTRMTDISARTLLLDGSANYILGYQTIQDNSLNTLLQGITSISNEITDIIIPAIIRHDTSLGVFESWMGKASVSLDVFDGSINRHASNIHDLSVSFQSMNNSTSGLLGNLSTLSNQYSSLESSLNPLLGWDASLSRYGSSIVDISGRTQFISGANAPSHGNITTFNSTTSFLKTSSGTLDAPIFSITAQAVDRNYSINWTPGTAASGIARAFDALIDTDCAAMTFMGTSANEKGLRLGLADGESAILYGTDLSVNGNLFTSGLTCTSLACTGLVTANRIARPSVGINASSNKIILDYANGDTFHAINQPTGNYDISLTNIPNVVNRTYTFHFIYTAANRVLNHVSARNVNAANVFTSGAPLLLNGSALSSNGTVKVCELTFICLSTTTPANNYMLGSIYNYQ